MDTLKLTTLTLLIPLGWATSVEAHMQPLGRLAFGPALTCHMAQSSNAATTSQDNDAAATNAMFRAIGSTSALQEPPSQPKDLCLLEFDPIDID